MVSSPHLPTYDSRPLDSILFLNIRSVEHGAFFSSSVRKDSPCLSLSAPQMFKTLILIAMTKRTDTPPTALDQIEVAMHKAFEHPIAMMFTFNSNKDSSRTLVFF